MFKVVNVEEAAHKSIGSLIDGEVPVIGLAIGQCGEQGECYVVHIVRTPLESTEDESSTTINDTGNVKSAKQLTSSKNKSAANVKKSDAEAFEKWDVDLVVQHAKQVTRMLLGGFDVLGVFACSRTDKQFSTVTLAACKQILSKIYEMQLISPVPSKIFSTERLFLHINCSSNKFLFKSMDVTSTLASPRIVDHKVISTRWIRLQCRLAINETIHLSNQQSDLNLAKQIRVGLDPLRTAIEESIYVIEGRMRNENDPLEANAVGTRKEKKTIQQFKGPTELNVDFLLNTNSVNLTPRLTMRECNVAMQMRGTIQGRTHVPNKATIGDAIKCLKLDVLRSLIGRCEIHCEDLLVIDEEQLDRVLVHELPCRIFTPLSLGVDLTVSDFLFPGEQACDSLDALSELLDISPLADDIDVACERPAASSDRTPSPADEQHDTGVPVEEMLPPKAPQSCNYIFLGVSVSIALVAVGTSFYMFL